MKATPQEMLIHTRMLAGDDPTAFAELCEWFYGGLVTSVRARRTDAERDADPALVQEAVGVALLSYNSRPSAYDPEGMSLERYLVMAAYRDFQNAYNKELRRRGPMGKVVYLSSGPSGKSGEDEESGQVAALDVMDSSDELTALFKSWDREQLWKRLDAAFPDLQDRQIIRLIADGERRTLPYAQVLGVQDLPQSEAEAHVKRAKDRIKKKLRRMKSVLEEAG